MTTAQFPLAKEKSVMPNSPATGDKTRRDFLKASAAGAATIAGLSIARSAHAAGDETIRIGMIGCGGRNSGAASESLTAGPYVKLVAMYDVFEDRVQASRKFLKDRFLTRSRWLTTIASGLQGIPESDRERRRGADRLCVEVSLRCTPKRRSRPG
jgi:hypothetical protein